MSDLTPLEERIAHLTRTVEDLSEVIARQDRELAQLSTRVELLMRREADREAADGGAVTLVDQKPPHW
jgi:SlyX protein